MKNTVKKLTMISLSMLMVFTLLPGMSRNVNADENKPVSGTVYRIDQDRITLEDSVYLTGDVDGEGVLPRGSYSLSDEGVSEDKRTIRLSSGADHLDLGINDRNGTPIGIECVSGDGTREKPYTFVLITDTIAWNSNDISEISRSSGNTTVHGISVSIAGNRGALWKENDISITDADTAKITFVSDIGKIKSITINGKPSSVTGFSSGWTVSDTSLTWSGEADDSVSLSRLESLEIRDITSIVFTVKAEGKIGYETKTVSKTVEDAAFTNPLSHIGDSDVTYSIKEDTDVADIDSEGKVTIKGAGTATITAEVKDTDRYAYPVKTASYTLTVAPAAVHTHVWSYTVGTDDDTNKITAVCSGEGLCSETKDSLVLTISTPESEIVYDGQPHPAVLNTGYSTVAFPDAITDVSYTKDGEVTEGEPVETGTYVASVNVKTDDETVTASVTYDIVSDAEGTKDPVTDPETSVMSDKTDENETGSLDNDPTATYDIVFSANNKQTVVTDIKLPYTLSCNEKADGELDAIIKELYGLNESAECDKAKEPVSTDDWNVTAGKENGYHFITVNAMTADPETVKGLYYNKETAEDTKSPYFEYALNVVCVEHKEETENKTEESIEMNAYSTTENIIGEVFANMINESLRSEKADGSGSRVASLDDYPIEHHERDWYGNSERLRDLDDGNYLVYRDSFLILSEKESSNYEVLWSKDRSIAYVSPAIPADQLEGKTGIVFLSNDISTDTVIVFGSAAEYKKDTMMIPVLDTSVITVNMLFSDGRLQASSNNSNSNNQKRSLSKSGSQEQNLEERPIIPTVNWDTKPEGTNWKGELSDYSVEVNDAGYDFDIWDLSFYFYLSLGVHSDFAITTSGATKDSNLEKAKVASISIPINKVVSVAMIYDILVQFDGTPIIIKGRINTELDYALGINYGVPGADIKNFKTPVDLTEISLVNASDANKNILFFVGSAFESRIGIIEYDSGWPFYIHIGPILSLEEYCWGGYFYGAKLHKNEYSEPDTSKSEIHVCTKTGDNGCWKIDWHEWQHKSFDITINLYFDSWTFSIKSDEETGASGYLYNSLTYNSGIKEGFCPHIYYNVPVAVWRQEDDHTIPVNNMTVTAMDHGDDLPNYWTADTEESNTATLFLPWRENYKYRIEANGVIGGQTVTGYEYQPNNMVKGMNDRVDIVINIDARINVSVNKVWDIDISGNDKPESIKVVLESRDGTTGDVGDWHILETATLNEANEWQHTFANQYKYIKDDSKILPVEYRILELSEGWEWNAEYQYLSDTQKENAKNFIKNNKVSDDGTVTYSIPNTTSQNKTQYCASYETYGQGGGISAINTTITNKAICTVNINKIWHTLGMEKPSLYLALLYAPEDGWETEAAEKDVPSEWIPVINPRAGSTNSLNELIQKTIMKTKGDLGFIGNVRLAITEVKEASGWETSYTVDKYREGIPMQFKAAELDSKIVEDLLRYEYDKEQSVTVKSFGNFNSVSGIAYKTGDGTILKADVINSSIPVIGGSVIWKRKGASEKPENVTITIYDDKNNIVDTVTVSAPTDAPNSDIWNWIYESENLKPDVTYTIKETIPAVVGGIWVPEIKGLDAINHWYETEQVRIRIRAIFEFGNQDPLPGEINVDLLNPDGTAATKDIILEKDSEEYGSYTYVFTPENIKENFFNYSIIETSEMEDYLPDYHDVEVTMKDGFLYYDFVVINKSQFVNASGTVKWEGDTGRESMRPETVKLNIMNDKDEIVRSVEVPVDGDGKWNVERLPVVDSTGNTISYHVVEDDVKDYVECYAVPVYDQDTRTYICDVTNELGLFTFKIEKVIQGYPKPEDKDEVFRFLVSPYNNGAPKEMPEPSNPKPTIKGEGIAVEELIIDKPGVYAYVIKELEGSKGYDYDDTEWMIVITLSIDKSGRPSYNSWIREVHPESGSHYIPVKTNVVTFINKVSKPYIPPRTGVE